MFARLSLRPVAAVVLLLLPSVVAAQQSARTARSRPGAGPRLEVTAAAMRPVHADVRADTSNQPSAALAQRQTMGRPVALMVVGGAAVILGAVIGDAPGTLFMIGGAVAFLYGLYHYLE